MENKSLDLMIRMGIVKEQAKEVIENNKKGIITEMALPRKSVKSRVVNIFPQIIENWCLIHYVTLSGDKEIYKNHWQNELLTHLMGICRLQIKENDSFDSRKKLFNQIMIEEDFTTPNSIHLVITAKFKKEGIDRTTEIYNNILIDFINNINTIVNLISNKNDMDIEEYIDNL